ncbi:MAG: hypothetical protein JWR80_2227 [Bradyrhizobium sp.]|nr:hypothetical protein [Bradyrhizobium sp.]
MQTVLKNALAEYRALAGELEMAAQIETKEGRRELIALRRRLIEAFTNLGRLAQSAIGTAEGADGAALTEELRLRLSTARHDIAGHQARWPAVAIDHQSPEYRESARIAANSNRLLTEWIEAKLTTRPQSRG